MLTLHTAELLVPGAGSAALPGGAVLVDGDLIARVGPYAELAAEFPHARVRRWPGVLTPGLLVRGADVLLERTYYPDDPYEVTELGADPITGAEALADLKLTESRWGNSARRATQKLLARGVVAVAGRLTIPVVRTAVVRSGLTLLPCGGRGVLGPAVAGPVHAAGTRPNRPSSASWSRAPRPVSRCSRPPTPRRCSPRAPPPAWPRSSPAASSTGAARF